MDDPSFLIFLLFVGLVVLLVYARRNASRLRRNREEFTQTVSALTARVHALEQQLKSLTEITSSLTARLYEFTQAHPAAEPGKAVAPTTPSEKPATPAPVPVSQPKPVVPAPPPPTGERVPQPPPSPAAPHPREVGGIPLMPSSPKPPAYAPAAHGHAESATPATAPPSVTAAPKDATAALAAQVADALAQKAAAGTMAGSTAAPPVSRPPVVRVQAVTRVPFENVPVKSTPAITIPKIAKPKLTLEEIGTRWLPKIGITVVVLGVSLYTASKWEHVPPFARILIFYVLSAGMLALGIFFERKDKYKILGRVLIGGGWAISFFTTYAMRHVEAARVMHSDVLDLFLMLAVAAAMVWHTLRYNSQLVTGAAFLLGFVAVSISHETAFSMSAGAILALGMTILVVSRRWFELEIFGILASYLNHFYWLYETFQRFGHQQFPGYWASVFLMICYWAIFRTSYLIRRPADKKQESISTFAALLSPLLFLGVMKYQSFHPEWAFYALLVMGAVEFTLGQLPLARRRTVPFQILSSLGATLMVVAIPFKFAGRHTLEVMWMAGAEAFLLAGVLTRERLFRYFGGIISLLVGVYLFAWPMNGIVSQAAKIVNGEPHYDASLSIVLAVVAALLYLNSHIIGQFWKSLFDWDVEQLALTVFSYIASLFAVGAVYSSTRYNAIAVVLAVLVTALAWTGRQFRISHLIYQAHWIAAVAIADVSITGIHLDAAWLSIPERLITFGLVAALLYLSSNFVGLDILPRYETFVVLYRWAGSGLIALLIWLQTWFAIPRRDWLIAVLWTALALTLAFVARLLNRNEFRWQALTLAMMSFFAALALNFTATQEFHGLTWRLISVTLVACGIYLLARGSPMPQVKPAYSWAGTILLGYLAYTQTVDRRELWTPVLWAVLAATLVLAARYWKDRHLLWQTHLLALAATAWTIFVSLLGNPEHSGTRTQLFTVLITSALLYGLTWMTNIAGLIESDRIWQAYSWAGSLLLTWLGWFQLQPINLSLAWGVFALLIFEIGYKAESSYLRLQAYLAVACSFAHLFYSNFNTLLPAGTFDPRIFLIVLLVPIYFWIYWRLHEKGDARSGTEKKLQLEYLLPYFGTATIAALVRFEIPAESVAMGYAVIVLAAFVVSWQMRLQVFLHQALIMLGVAAFRLSLHNFRNLQNSFVSTLPGSILAIAFLAFALPVAFKLRMKNSENSGARRWIQFLLRRPEHALFFVTVGLTIALLYIRMHGMVLTLAWCVEGVAVILGAFFVREKAFVWTGLLLVLFSSGKIFVDLAAVDASVRYLAMIGVGAIILVAGYLFAKNRDALREYL